MPTLAWFALFLLLGAGLAVFTLLLLHLLARRGRTYVLPAADRRTEPLPSTAPPIDSPQQEPAAADNPVVSDQHPLQPLETALPLDSGPHPSAEDEPDAGTTEPSRLPAASGLQETSGSVCCDCRSVEHGETATADSEPAEGVKPDASRADGAVNPNPVDDHDAMRITKRSSGGRGEYEISETFGRLTPRDLLNCSLVLDLDEGWRIPSGVRLLDRNGKRRLRIDPSSGAEIHLHRQLAAALLMPYPARGETAWGTGEPVMQSDHYGIGNIDLSRVELGQGAVVIVPEQLEIANSDRQAHVDCAERLQQVRRLWNERDGLPSRIATLLAQHEQEATQQMPLGPRAEAIVADLQRATAAHARTLGRSQGDTADAVPFLLSLLDAAAAMTDSPASSAVPALHTVEQTQPHIPEPVQPAAPAAQTYGSEAPAPTDATAASEVNKPDAVVPAIEPPLEEITEEIGEAEPVSTELPESKPPAIPQPRRYQPSARGSARKRRTGGAKPHKEPAERSCLIEVRLRSRTGGALTLSLLPRRRNGMPEEVEVSGAGETPLTLSALHEAWYQDVIPPDLDCALRKGAAWYADQPNGRLQWMLSGRDLYILGPRDELSGYVSTSRLILGDQHVVLCIAELRERVLAILEQCCETAPLSIDPEDGLPPGWAGFRGVCPIRSLPPSNSPDILDALRPAPDVQITLRGGIRLQYSQWLVGYPPAIRLVGAEADAPIALTIDGHAAARQTDGAFTAPGWDRQGDHLVACGALTRSYSLVAPPDSWESWPAYSQSGNLAVCGAAVGTMSPAAVRPSVVVPATNPLLLGQHPGQIYLCPPRTDMLGFCVGAPPFRPVWAVPAAPLKADKSTACILLLDWPVPLNASGQTDCSGVAVRQWLQAILDCSRKGLRLANETPAAMAIWRACREKARAIWRHTR